MTNSLSEQPETRPPGRPHEFALIAELFAPLAKDAPGAFGLLDDAAIIAPPDGYELVTTVDALVEGVHFRPDDPPELVAKKALRVNLSDLAAKGAEPVGYLLTLVLPASKDMAWLRAFAHGLEGDQKEFALPLLGGDTTRTPGPLTLSVTAFGTLPKGDAIRRAGARPGDLVFVSGTIGDAGGGLAILTGNAQGAESLIARYRLPCPRLSLGQALRGVASAALDVSDGLVADLGHIAEVSKVHIAIDAAAIPRSAGLRALWGDRPEAIIRAATAGDDYELAFTAPAASRPAVLSAARQAGVAVTGIGRVEPGEGVHLLGEGGRELAVPRAGWTHF